MKRTIYLYVLLAMGTTLHGQDYRQKIQGDASGQQLEITYLAARLIIEGHNSDELVIETDDYRGIPEKAKGLKPLSATGEDNTSVGLHLKKEGTVWTISGASRASDNADYRLKVPQGMKLKIDSESFNAQPIEVKGMQNEVEIKANSSDVKLVDVTGPLVLNSLNGSITISFSTLNQANPSSINATNGDIDITLPATTKADFDLRCLNGEIYTNLEIELDSDEKSKLRRIGGGMNAKGTSNGGGVQFSANAINGNIYLRKE